MNKIKKSIDLLIITVFSIVLIGCADSQTSSVEENQHSVSKTPVSTGKELKQDSGGKSTESETVEEKQTSMGNSDTTTAKTDLNDIAKKYIPAGAKIIHTVVEGEFAQTAKSKSEKLVVLYREKFDLETDPYKTLVLMSKGSDAWDKYELPQPEYTWSIMEPMAVFFENVDKDSDNELLILEEAMTGAGPTGAQPFYRTRVYDWQQGDFKHLENISEKIDADANTAAKVRKQLKKITK